MVNSFGARKKAPYADALRRITTAAAPRTLLVMIFLDLRSIASHAILEVFCFDTDSNGPLANPLFSHRFRNPGGRGAPRQTAPSHSSKRYSPKSHTAVKKMMSNAIRNASQSHRSTGCSAQSAR